jgi:hypothetical protein
MIIAFVVAVVVVGIALGFWAQGKLREKGQL